MQKAVDPVPTVEKFIFIEIVRRKFKSLRRESRSNGFLFFF